MRRAYPQDLVAIGQSIASFFMLTETYMEHYRCLLTDHVTDTMMESLVTLMQTLMQGIREECQGPYSPGKVIAKGFSESLDALRELQHDGDRSIRQYVSELKEQTGIPTIKLSQNKIIGHFIEIPKTHGDRVPQWFHRKQTLVSAERYTTDQLIALESDILASGEKADEMERTLYEQLLTQAASLHEELMLLGRFFSTIDCYQSMAQCATLHHYCRPELTTEDVLQITAGRHPVVEQALAQGEFVTNGLSMGGDDERFCLITGPNMAGKSTYLRQNALIVLLAHMGSYVPADTARIGLTDKLFCRVGASDNLARGESTFLIEMQEAAGILRTATSRSLAIMDEIGRGTSTQDGMSIAYAVMREMVQLQVKTLFATHYHELTMLDTTDMQLLTLAVAESRKSIVFLRKIQPGVADSSYGLHVAKMAGIPLHVIRQASQFQKQHFADYELKSSAGQLDLFTGNPDTTDHQFVISSLRSFNLNESTPLEALHFIEQLQQQLLEADTED
jgi:DNA mismatch repair protein MutS